MLLRIDHETKLIYTEPVYETVIKVRMAPQSGVDQTALHYRLKTTPAASVTGYRDGFGNRVDLFNVLVPHREVAVSATSFVQTHRSDARQRLAGLVWSPDAEVELEAVEFLRPSQRVGTEPAVREFVDGLPRTTGPLLDVAEALMAAVRGRLKYEKRVTDANTPVADALGLGRGVCQDFAHLFLAACRGTGLPARYVSGYVNHPGEIATHAWCQIWAGRAGWVDVDPTTGRWASDDHVVTAVGRDYADVPPNRGVWKGTADERIEVTVKVQPVERLPPEATEPAAAPVWTGGFQQQSQGRGRAFQQQQARGFRQQQSQQQQSDRIPRL
ncbi:MAG: transglutaminase family protein [Gemmataceae bacterium]